jgi:hypothetical protein
MKDWDFKKIITFALAMTSGFIIYDLFFKADIEWGRAIFAGVFAGLALWLYSKYSVNKK